jgi:hypothetical protein
MGGVSYDEFLEHKSQADINHGFDPVWMPDWLFGFQKELVSWSLKKGRAAIFADCGLGKTPMQLVWAENIVRKTNANVLILTPLAVAAQTVREGEKFGIECEYSKDGNFKKKIVVTNYERLHYFDWKDFEKGGCVCDESSAIKHFSGTRQMQVTRFMRKLPYRLLCTATAAPNDHEELGTSSEALGYMPYMDMLQMFFWNQQNTVNPRQHWIRTGGPPQRWRFKKHAEKRFWQWVCSWARAVRKPSDMGFPNDGFNLPELITNEIVVETTKPLPGYLLVVPAVTISEQRAERKLTINERCEEVAKRVNGHHQALVWCQYNPEGDLLEKIIPDAVQIAGSDSPEKKEEAFWNFANGQIRVLVTKPKIGAFGLNFQNCNHMTFFPSHSYEQYYQGVRRCWRFGQTRPVKVDIVTTRGEFRVMRNLARKAAQADKMFDILTKLVNQAKDVKTIETFKKQMEVPAWIK